MRNLFQCCANYLRNIFNTLLTCPMREYATLKRVTQELKDNYKISLKSLSELTDVSYIYLTRMVSGNVKFTDTVYDKIMEVARNKGIDVTVYTTRSSTPAEPAVSMDIANAYGIPGNMTITLKLQVKNNKITAVEWDTTPLV